MQINANSGFSDIFTSIDYLHWERENCQVVWQGQFQDKDRK